MTDKLEINSRNDWTPELLERVWKEIEIIAVEELELRPGIELYTNQFEIVSAEQMLDAYSSIGLPVHYNHWSFGKDFMQSAKQYEKGRMGLAYEMVINSNPCVNLLMEENLAYMQTMVMAHAGVGHNAVFANNVYFKEWTQAGSIIDYMLFARDYIQRCEERYGLREVEQVLDAAHSLASHGIDKFKRKHRPKLSDEARLKKLMAEDDRRQRELDIILQKTTIADDEAVIKALDDDEDYLEDDEENLLYYIMKKSPNLDRWKREILRIVYKVNQYFSPQGPTKTLNEGMATFCHHYIMERLEEKGVVTSDAFMAYLTSHSGVIYQPNYDSRYYSGPNPYALGFAIMQDIKRICEGGEWAHTSKGSKWIPITDEDRRWFPELIGRKWQDVVKEAAFEHRDDSFIMQYLSPKVIRDLKLFTVTIEYQASEDNPVSATATVTEIHDDIGYANIRTALARSKERVNYVPQIVVEGADLEGDRTLYLRYDAYMGRELDESDAEEVLSYLDDLWGYKVQLEA
jgi:spore cortex formation protein SpoVR/YcgB (stage V sporulation)